MTMFDRPHHCVLGLWNDPGLLEGVEFREIVSALLKNMG